MEGKERERKRKEGRKEGRTERKEGRKEDGRERKRKREKEGRKEERKKEKERKLVNVNMPTEVYFDRSSPQSTAALGSQTQACCLSTQPPNYVMAKTLSLSIRDISSSAVQIPSAT
ncbi:Myosin-M heavy chain, partial [Ophiophagus hannah]